MQIKYFKTPNNMTTEEIKQILELHKLFLESKGSLGKRANLSNANLSNTPLSNTYLSNADLRNANLYNADLSNTNLSNTHLSNTHLSNANLRDANLSNANLYNANLRDANLYNANLRNANLSNADLRNANLRNANLSNANLSNTLLPLFCKWTTGVIDNKNIRVGCETKSPEEWENWLASEEEFSTPRTHPDFKQIEAVIRAYIAYLKTLNS
jgi:hypothetical protein